MIRKTARYLLLSFATVIAIILLYFGMAYVTSAIIIDKKPQVLSEEKVVMYILSNGVHTDLVMPTKNQWHDWTIEFPYHYTQSKDSSLPYIAVGWGDKGFYLNTPTWADLTAAVACNAMFGLGGTAVHATYHDSLLENQHCISIVLSATQYLQLIQYIQQSLVTQNGRSVPIPTNAVYGLQDAFYEASGKYNMFHTCNTWTNNALKASGQKACWWTPFQSGIMNAYQP